MMKTKKNPIGTCVLSIALAIIIALAIVVGVSDISAEPTIDQLVEKKEIGTFVPSNLYNDDNANIKLAAWLNTTHLMFSYDWWRDTSGDGVIDVEDVYGQNGFEQEMLMTTMLYPIFETDKNDNYYIVALPDYQDINGVVIEFQIAENNDLGNLKDRSMYWYDHDNSYLYINKDLIKSDVENEIFTSIRAESIMLVKDISTATRSVNIYTLFSEDIKDTQGLDSATPNETYDANINKWLIDGLRYQLVKSKHLAYVSNTNLTVFVNGVETDAWSYDNTTGTITIYCDPYTTRDVAVRFDALNDASAAQQMLQHLQTNSEIGTAQATSLEDALMGNNMFLHYLQYDNEPPKVGTTQSLGFTGFAYVNKNGQCVDVGRLYGGTEGLPISIIKSTVTDRLKDAQKVGSYFQSATLGALQSEGYTRFDEDYGNVVYNLFLANKNKNEENLNKAVSIAESYLLGSVGTTINNAYWSKALTTIWVSGVDSGRYITGTLNESFLGGKVLDDSGRVFFDVTCARIEAPNAEAVSAMKGEYGWVTNENLYDYRANATIVQVSSNDEGTGGYIYVCVWSKSLLNGSDSRHSQRILAFSRIPYKYNGSGKIQLSKTDAETGESVSGAKYTIYKDAACQTAVETITTGDVPVKSKDLPAGTYYVKETTPPTGYLRDNSIYEIKIEGGKVHSLRVEDEQQKCDFSLTVYDQTTKGSGYEIPLAGITFEMSDPNGDTVGTYTTDENGQIQGTVDATGIYHLKQLDTINNYSINTDRKSGDYCLNIAIDATPDKSGSNIACNVIHYEHRQTVSIMSHVQDENLLDKTPADLGGDKDSNSWVSTVGATYRLRTKSAILLGYEKGNAVIVEPGEILTILTYNKTDGSKGYTTDAVSCNNNNQSFIIAEGVQYNGKNYPLPNGEYQWVMVAASEGYYNDHDHNTTDIDAKWVSTNNKIPNLSVDQSVLQKRQRVEIELFVKSYVDDDRLEQDTLPNITGQYIQRENALTNLRPKDEALADKSNRPQQDKFIISGITKTVISDQLSISATSKEDAILYDDGVVQYSIKSSGLVQNAIYEVMTLCDVVDINTGKTVLAGSVVGIYLSNENGQILISNFGSDRFDNPNNTSKDSYPRFGDIVVLADDNVVVNGPLPNGTYGVSLIAPPDNHKEEKGLSEDIMFELGWGRNNTTNIHVVKTSASVFINRAVDAPGDVKNNVIIAPDTPVNESDIYNPNDPDNPSDPDDSDDIVIVSTDWIDRNQYNVSYRVVDSFNIQVNNSSTIYDVNDTLPVTFAFYLKNDACPDDTHSYQYNVSFYYEISKAEYDSANQDAKDSKQYIQVGEGKYARRFKTESLSGGDYLQDVIALNQKSPGYINYSEMKDNLTISGAIYNTSWINEKLAAQSNGEYHIYIYVDTIETYFTKGSEQKIVVRHAYRDGGVLTIKNRQLINLD